ncbi:MAG: hypothetical protein ACN6I7_01665 [bacterium]
MQEHISADLIGWDAIELHRTGTPGDAQTAEWLASLLRAAGAEAQVDRFPFQRRVPGDCFVSDGERRAEGLPLLDGGATGPEGFRGAAGAFGSDRAIGVGLFVPYEGDPRTRLLQATRAGSGHRALVAVAAGEPWEPGLTVLNAERYAAPFGAPVLQVATEHAAWLTAAAVDGRPLTVAAPMTMDAAQACNVQVTFPGRRPELAPLVIMTPCSGWWTCTSERGGGIAVWLAAARHFAERPPERPVILTANTGHELGHVGLERFLTQHPELPAHAHAWVHLGANFAAADGALRYQASDAALMTLGIDALGRAGLAPPDVTPIGTRPYGEARDVFDQGGRYVSLLGSNRLFHHPNDRWPHAVSVERTVRATRAMLDVIDALSRD